MAIQTHPSAPLDYLSLPATAVTFHDRYGTADYIETSSSSVLFARLHACALDRAHIVRFAQGGRELAAASLATLNCYLRSVAIGRCGLPWHAKTLTRTKHDWRDFVAHLELVFR